MAHQVCYGLWPEGCRQTEIFCIFTERRSMLEIYTLSTANRCRRPVQVPCWEEPGSGTGKETAGVHVCPRMQRGRHICTSLFHSSSSSLKLVEWGKKAGSDLSLPFLASAGPVSHSDRLLLVRHQWRQTSERLLCAQQDPGVFRYCWGKKSCLVAWGWKHMNQWYGYLFSQSRHTWHQCSAGLSRPQTVWWDYWSNYFTA